MTRTPYDSFAKDLVIELLSPFGRAEGDARIASDPQFADVYFKPPEGAAVSPASGGFVRRLAAVDRAIFEVAQQPPTLAVMASWQRKQLALWQSEQNLARRTKRSAPTLPPVLWGLSSGAPEQAMRSYRMEPMLAASWPTGCYEGAPDGTFRLVVISELPTTRDTLLLRTMGRGETFERAMEDLDALPANAPERDVAGHFLVSLRLQLQNDPSDEARRMTTQSQKIYEAFSRKLRSEGRRKGRQEGRQEGAVVALRDAIAEVCRARALPLSDAQRERLATEADLDVLRRWLGRAATASHAAELFDNA
jgi:hypothetical protein